jgi:preprotein translocase subunit Sec61beta
MRVLMGRGMANEKRGEGFHSAAGLIRYFDQEDEKAIKIPPWFVVAFGIGIAAAVVVAAWQWPV